MYSKINLSIITYYEILSGLKHKDAHKQLSTFLTFAKDNNIVLLTEESVTCSAEIYAQMRKQGTPIDDIDLLIACVALVNDWPLRIFVQLPLHCAYIPGQTTISRVLFLTFKKRFLFLSSS